MKKSIFLFCLLFAVVSAMAAPRDSFLSRNRNNRAKASEVIRANQSDSVYNSISQLYADGSVAADSVVNLALYHKVWNPRLTERCLRLVAEKNPRALMELGVIYAFSPEFKGRTAEGIRLLQTADKNGLNEANCYLGLYYFNQKDYKNAKTCFDASNPIEYGFGETALGSMYVEGKGVEEDLVKAREHYRLAALKGYARGMALYGFNLRASAVGSISYPDSFFWLYIAGDLGDDAARTALYLPRRNENRGDSEVAKDALTALQWIAVAQSGKKIQNEPIYKEGFLPSLKAREKAAEQGDDWARFYLGSMNYNGDFLNQNYAQVLHYYEPIVRNGKLPKSVLALVNERLAEMYREGKGVKPDAVKAAKYARAAAQYGNLSAYKIVEHISE